MSPTARNFLHLLGVAGAELRDLVGVLGAQIVQSLHGRGPVTVGMGAGGREVGADAGEVGLQCVPAGRDIAELTALLGDLPSQLPNTAPRRDWPTSPRSQRACRLPFVSCR